MSRASSDTTPTSSSSAPGPAARPPPTTWPGTALDVLLLEKTEFPREKVCGDGLTPRAVKQLIEMGIDTSERGRLAAQQGPAGHRRRRPARAGLARAGQLPRLRPGPHPAATSTRCSPARPSRPAPSCGPATNVTGPVLDDAPAGSSASTAKAGPDKEPRDVPRAAGPRRRRRLRPVRRSRMGLAKRDDRPMGVAVRRYYRTPARHDDDYLESWLELWDGEPDGDKLLPGYGWIFGMGDGTVNVGLGVLNSSTAFGKTDYRDAAAPTGWTARPEEWGCRRGQRRRPDPRRRAADGLQPDAALHARAAAGRRRRRHGQPVQRRGHRVRDGVRRAGRRGRGAGAGPAGRPGAGARAARLPDRAEGAATAATTGSAASFVKLIGQPEVMRIATRHGLPHPTLMRFVLKLLANLTDPRDGDAIGPGHQRADQGWRRRS